jgi:hypothetical protein
MTSDWENRDSALVAVSADFKVTGVRHDADLRLVGGVNGYAIIQDDKTVRVVKGSDFENEVWSESIKDMERSSVLQDGNTFYVLTDDGYADGTTGKAKGFGDDAADSSTSYRLLSGGVLLRCESDEDSDYYSLGSAMRINPDDGKKMWDTSVKNVYCRDAVSANGVLVLTNDKTVYGIQPSDGKEKWNVKGYGVQALNSGYVLTTASSASLKLKLLDPKKDGETLATFGDVTEIRGLVSGKKVFYTWDAKKLKAWSATGDSDSELWSLNLKGGGDIIVHEGRMFVMGSDGSNNYDDYDDYYSSSGNVWLQEVVKN